MRQALGPGALGRPGGSGWRGRWEGGSGWGRHVNSKKNNKQTKKKDHLFFIHSFVHGHLSFHVWSVVNNAVVNME